MEETKDTKLCKSCGSETCCGKCHKRGGGGMSSGVYGLAFIGALVYFMQTVATFSGGVMALLKAIVWPALLVYHLLSFLMV